MTRLLSFFYAYFIFHTTDWWEEFFAELQSELRGCLTTVSYTDAYGSIVVRACSVIASEYRCDEPSFTGL